MVPARVVAALLGLLAAPGAHAAGPPWPDTPVARLKALVVLQGFNADLLSHASATLTLERWCGAHRLVPEGRITAELDRGEQARHGRAARPSAGRQRRAGGAC